MFPQWLPIQLQRLHGASGQISVKVMHALDECKVGVLPRFLHDVCAEARPAQPANLPQSAACERVCHSYTSYWNTLHDQGQARLLPVTRSRRIYKW